MNAILNRVEESSVYRYFALVCLGAYSMMNIPFPEFYENYIQVFSYLVVLVFFLARSPEKKILPYWLFFVVLIYVAISWWLGHLQEPIYYSGNMDLHKLGRHFLFVVVAYYLCNNKGSFTPAFVFLSLMFVGAFFVPWSIGSGWADINRGLAGQRVDFNMQNAQHTGVLYGAALIMFLVFSKRVYLFDKRLFFAALVASICYFSYVCFSQTRAVFIALVLAAIIGLLLLLHVRGRDARVLVLTSVVLAPISILSVFLMPRGLILEFKRLYSFYLDGNLLLSSMGARLQSWLVSWDWVESRPLLGWGSEASRMIIQNSEITKDTWMANFYFMHNSMVEIVVCYGILGLSLYVGLVIWFWHHLGKLHKTRGLPTDVYIFSWCFFVYWVTVNMFESHMFFRAGVGIFNVVCAFLCFFIYQEKLKSSNIKG